MAAAGATAAAAAIAVELLPHGWTDLLDTRSFLRLQCTAHAQRMGAPELDAHWARLCASKLGLTQREDGSSARGGGCGGLAPHLQLRNFGTEASSRSISWQWLPVLRDLDTSSISNELRHTPEEYLALPGAHGAGPPSELEFSRDARGRVTRCRLLAPLGGDRCVLAARPLPSLKAATAYPVEEGGAEGSQVWKWHLGHRLRSYYEVSMLPAPGDSRPRMDQCVSVGLATRHVTARSLRREQAGWDHTSWALHGDDGHLYHGSGQGRPLEPFIPYMGPWAGVAAPKSGPLFGAGDVVGCGVVGLAAPSRACTAAIFFTLNGQLLGAHFFLPRRERLWPFVGIDAHWLLEFNFGGRPFAFDLDAVPRAPQTESEDCNLSSLRSMGGSGESRERSGSSRSSSDLHSDDDISEGGDSHSGSASEAQHLYGLPRDRSRSSSGGGDSSGDDSSSSSSS